MNKVKYSTAKERIENGDWEFYRKYSKGIGSVYYYISKSKHDGKLEVHFMHSASFIGVPVLMLTNLLCKILAKIFNLFGNKVGDNLFEDIIEESSELLKARNHKLSTGLSYSLPKHYETLQDVDEAINKEIKRFESR